MLPRGRPGRFRSRRLNSRILGLGLALALVTGGLVTFRASPALADSTLCSSNTYSDCTTAGFTEHQYSVNSGTSYWGAYTGHNCTNYAAYMESQINGASGSTSGDAKDWDNNVTSGVTVNTTAAVGSIAQWEANVGPAGQYGHVGYVESINGDGSITVSADNYPVGSSYPFWWKVFSPGGGNWPSHFIHFKDLPADPGWGGVGSGANLYSGGDTLAAGDTLNAGYYLLSADGRFALLLQSDGNLVLYNGVSIWSSGTGGLGATKLTMQTDGNLVLYKADNTSVWQSNTSNGHASHLVVQNDGNVVTYRNDTGGPTWWTGTGSHPAISAYGSDRLTNTSGEQHLDVGYYLQSPNKEYALLLHSGGYLVLYGPGYHVIWQMLDSNAAATKLVMQSDHNLVAYNGTGALWYTATGGTSNRVVLQDDGNLVVYNSSDVATWQSGTGGHI